MNEVNKTLFIPLYGKAKVSHKGIILQDKWAEDIWNKADFRLKGKARSKWLSYYMSMRARVFDDWVRMRTKHDADALVLHVGAGLDSRAFRVEHDNHWYDIDFEDVISLRREYYSEGDRYHMMAGDMCDPTFLDAFSGYSSVIVILEGVSMYVELNSLQQFFIELDKRFERVSVLADMYTMYGAKMSRHNPITTVGATKTYGIASPIMAVSNTDIRYLAEHSMTPEYLISELKGMERFIFRHVFAGSFAKKIYKIYEYIK